MKKQNHSATKIVIIVLVLFLAIAAVFAFVVISETRQKQILFKEINQVNTTSTVNMEIKTSGEYGKLEKALKEHLKEYYDTLDNVTKEYSDTGLDNMLSATNISANGPEFNVQKEKLKALIKLGNEAKEKIIKMASKEYTENKIKEAKLDKKYATMYSEILDLQENAQMNSNVIGANNTYFEKLLELLNYLTDHSKEWKVNNAIIEFTTTELANKYNGLLNEAKDLASNIIKINK